MKNTGRHATATATITGMSSRSASSLTGSPSGATRAVRPRTLSRLNMFDPTALPTAMSRSPLTAATRDVASSGALVPSATTVSPITRSDTPSVVAISLAESTSQVEPSTRAPTPPTIMSTSTAGPGPESVPYSASYSARSSAPALRAPITVKAT